MNYQTSMNSFVIERDIPMPSRNRHAAGRPPVYPFDAMRKGDSFFVPLGGRKAVYVQSLVSAAARTWAKRNGGKFATRQVDGGVRVWRVK